MKIIEHCWVPMSDGRRLAAKLWLPENTEPTAAIFEYLPYRKRDGTAARDATTHKVFAEHGYACVRVDIAGTGESDGVFDDEYSEQELTDGKEIIAWIANQKWCDGNVGMVGISWGGFNGLQLAYLNPPALKAIVTNCSTDDRFADDIHYMGGCLLTENFGWAATMFAYNTRPADPALRDDWLEQLKQRIKDLPFMAVDWLKHPTRDAFWKHGSVCEGYTKISAATLAIGGWNDSYMNVPPALAAHMTAPVKALNGPWEHAYPHIAKINPADYHTEVLNWFDRWLKGIDNNADQLPDYRAFMREFESPSENYGTQKGHWIGEQVWPSNNITPLELYVSEGRLSDHKGNDTISVNSQHQVGQASGNYCPGMRVDNELPGDQTPDDALSLCFDTEPFQEEMQFLGRAKLRLEFSVDQPTAQICVRLNCVSPEGISQRITYRPFNLTHYASHEFPEPLEPNKIYVAEIDLNECAYQVPKGHHLRLAISTSYWPVVWPAATSATVNVHMAGTKLTLPKRSVMKEIEPHAPKMPRDFPRLQMRIIRDTESYTKSCVIDDGSHVLSMFDDFGKTENLEHGMIVGSNIKQKYRIHPDDPLSAEHNIKWQFELSRSSDDWHVFINTENNMSADADNFYLSRKVCVYLNDREIIQREWKKSVERGLL